MRSKNVLNKKIEIRDVKGNKILKLLVNSSGKLIPLEDKTKISYEENKIIISTDFNLNFFQEEVENYLYNMENEKICNMSIEEFNEIVERIADNVALDNEVNKEIDNSIEWFTNKYLYRDEEI